MVAATEQYSEESLGKLLVENFEKGVTKIGAIYGSNAANYNAVGRAYPRLARDQRDAALTAILWTMDRERWDVVQRDHTRYIREPLLLADVRIMRPLYWPGLERGEGERIIAKYGNFAAIKGELIDENGLFYREKVDSDFLVANALLRSDMCSFGEDYARTANSEFLYRVLKGLVANRFAKQRGRTEDVSDNEIQERTARLKELWPKSLHDQIEPLRLEQDWVDWTII